MKNTVYLKPLLILAPVVFIIIGSYLYLTQKKQSEGQAALEFIEKIKVLQDTEFVNLNGVKSEISQKSPVVILHFWASWCAPCVEEFPQIIELVKQNAGKVEVLAISGDSQVEEIEAFLKSFPEAKKTPHFHIVWDEKKEWVKKWAVQKLPESYIYKADRHLVKRVSGAVDWLTEDAKAFMKSLVEDTNSNKHEETSSIDDKKTTEK